MTLVLFDIDGTLLRGDGTARRAFEGALVEVTGAPPDPAVRYDGKTDPQIARELMRAQGEDDPAIDARIGPVIAGYVERMRREVRANSRHFVPLPGVAPLLDALERRRDAVLGLVTGNVADGAAVKLASAGLDLQRFRVNAFGSDHEHRPELPRVARARARALLDHDFPGRGLGCPVPPWMAPVGFPLNAVELADAPEPSHGTMSVA